MAEINRRRKKKNNNLKTVIALLAVILAVLLVVAISLPDRDPNEDTLQGGDSTPGISTQPQQSETTVPPTTIPPTTEPHIPLNGWVESDGNKYYYVEDVAHTGAMEVEGVLYCFADDGALMGEGWQVIGEETYYVTADGTAHIGWLEKDENLYYLQADGTMARGQLEIEGQTWFFTSTGCQIYMVNPWHKVPEGYEVKLVKLSSDYGQNRYVADFMLDPLMQMIYDCEAAMVDQYGSRAPKLWVRSANRSNYDQTCLFENKVNRVKAAHPEYTQAQAEAEAATVVAMPGTSEHQLGLAVDIIDTQIWELVEEQETLAGQQWLMENCWKYGFILRYPKGTTDVTGIIYEPWHYRYVGTELAAELHELGVTLEEYIANLTK